MKILKSPQIIPKIQKKSRHDSQRVNNKCIPNKKKNKIDSTKRKKRAKAEVRGVVCALIKPGINGQHKTVNAM